MQGNTQALQQRIDGLEGALRRQDSAVEKLQAGAKLHMEASLRQGAVRNQVQQASQKEDKLKQSLTRLEAELAATRRCSLNSFLPSSGCAVVLLELPLVHHM